LYDTQGKPIDGYLVQCAKLAGTYGSVL